MKQLFSLYAMVPVLLVLVVAGCGTEEVKYTGQPLPYTPEPLKEKEPNPVVSFQTSGGEVVCDLFEDDAPNTVANFITLAEKGYYNNTVFHRIVKDFCVQGGDPKGTGQGGPGYRIRDEIKGHPNKCDLYALAMANSGPNTNGSQFFFCTKPGGAHDLDAKHTVFGKITKGQDVVDKLNISPVDGQRPKPDVKLISVTVVSKRKHAYEVRDKLMDPTAAQPPIRMEKTEAAKTEPAKTVPAITEPVKTEPAKTDEKKEPAKAEEKKAGAGAPGDTGAGAQKRDQFHALLMEVGNIVQKGGNLAAADRMLAQAEEMYPNDTQTNVYKQMISRRKAIESKPGTSPAGNGNKPEDKGTGEDKKDDKGAAEMAEANPVVTMQTNLGEIVFELFEDAAPNTVANFIQLAEKGFYDDKIFHRIIKDFMIQGGDPEGTGRGGPGYRFADEFKNNPFRVDRYTLCMANAGPNTNGSQFFIVTKADGCDWLTGKHTVFGKVTKGFEIVDKLGTCKTEAGDRPNPEMKIVTLKVTSKRKHPYEVKKL